MPPSSRRRKCFIAACAEPALAAEAVCARHFTTDPCSTLGCPYTAMDTVSGCCSLHGGGPRCPFPDCGRSIKRPIHSACRIHLPPRESAKKPGETRICFIPGCGLPANVSTWTCMNHSTVAPCAYRPAPGSDNVPWCKLPAADSVSQCCGRHGGGRRCNVANCPRAVKSCRDVQCYLHADGGNVRYRTKAIAVRKQAKHRAKADLAAAAPEAAAAMDGMVWDFDASTPLLDDLFRAPFVGTPPVDHELLCPCAYCMSNLALALDAF